MGRAALVGTHGKVFAEHANVGTIPVYHDTMLSTFLVTGRALSLMPLWAAIPRSARYYATGIFRTALRTRGLGQYMLKNATVEVKARDLFSFRHFSGFTPPEALPLDFKEQALMENGGTWQTWLGLLALTNADSAMPEFKGGVVFDPLRILTGEDGISMAAADQAWVEQNMSDAALWPAGEAEARKQVSALAQQAVDNAGVTLTVLAHHEPVGAWMSAQGCVYPLSGLVALLAEQGLFVQSWRCKASRTDGRAACYVLDLRRGDEASDAVDATLAA